MSEAREETGAERSVIFVPAAVRGRRDHRGGRGRIELIVCITEGIPRLDMVAMQAALEGSGAR